MKSYLLLLLSCLILVACNKDDSSESTEEFTVTGEFFTPNSLDPVSGAHVRAYVDGQLQSQTSTDAQGKFAIDLNRGDYNLVINKGKFKSERTITVDRNFSLDSIAIESLPNIAVVTGSYDNIESVLYSIGLFNPVTSEPLFDIIDGSGFLDRQSVGHSKHQHGRQTLERNSDNPLLQPNVDFNFEDLISDQELLGGYDIVFLNCGVNESYEDQSDALDTYVSNGGILYATDWASGYLDAITNSGADYITPYVPEKSGTSTSTVATILNDDLNDWLLQNFNITIDQTVLIDDFLYSWQVIDTYDSNTAISWLNGPVSYTDDTGTEVFEDKDLAFTFLHGEGAVLYSSFHTENHDVDEVTDVERIMQFLVLEMSDTE